MIKTNKIEKNITNFVLNQFIKQPSIPYKYPPFCFALALTEKAFGDPIMRSTLLQQLTLVVTNTAKFTAAALDHLKRKTY